MKEGLYEAVINNDILKELDSLNKDEFIIDIENIETLFHWQSQSTTSDQSTTGQRYINHKKYNSKVVLFVRENQKSNGVTTPYTYLGLGEYISHSGSKPISIVWKLQEEIPAFMINKANKSIII